MFKTADKNKTVDLPPLTHPFMARTVWIGLGAMSHMPWTPLPRPPIHLPIQIFNFTCSTRFKMEINFSTYFAMKVKPHFSEIVSWKIASIQNLHLHSHSFDDNVALPWTTSCCCAWWFCWYYRMLPSRKFPAKSYRTVCADNYSEFPLIGLRVRRDYRNLIQPFPGDYISSHPIFQTSMKLSSSQ